MAQEKKGMTPEELEIFRLNVRVVVLRVLVRGLYVGMAQNSSPETKQALLETFAALRKEHSKIVLKGIAPEYSDMLSSEYQETLDDFLKDIERGIKE